MATPMPVDETVLNDLIAQIGDDAGSFRDELIGSYLAEGADQIGRFSTAALSNDAATVATIAHSLRSASALLGATPLAELLRTAEDRAKRSPGDLTSLAPPVEAEFAQVTTALRRLSSMGAQNP